MDISNNNNNAETTIDALASLSLSPEPALSSTVNEDGIVGSADVDTTAAISSTTHKNTNVTIRRTVNHSANDTAANQSSDIDVDGLLDDVDAVITHQELSCMKLGELKKLCKKKGLSTTGNMTTLIDRYLLAQKNGFPTKKKPMSQSERKAKSRANRSDEKKKEDNKKMLAYNTKVRKGEIDLIRYKQPTENTKVWEVPGKDYKLERHEENPIAAQMLFYDVSKQQEREATKLVAYVHVSTRFLNRIKKGNQGIKGEKRDRWILDEKEKDDYVAQHQTGLYILDRLYMISVREKISFLRFTAEIWETYGSEMKDKFRDWFNKTENAIKHLDEAFFEWLVLTDDGLEIACKVIRQKNFPGQVYIFSVLSSFKQDKSVSIIKPPFQEVDYFGRRLDQNEISLLQREFERYLEIHGFDVSWMKSIIGLRLSVPEWWWEDGSGNRYSKRSKLWKGEIVDISLPNYKVDDFWGLDVAYAKEDDPCRYFIFKCDEEDDYKYRMQYSDVWKFADENQPESFLLPKEMPTKYVDHKLHILCMFGHDQLKALDRARKLAYLLKHDDELKQVFEVLEKRLSTHAVLELTGKLVLHLNNLDKPKARLMKLEAALAGGEEELGRFLDEEDEDSSDEDYQHPMDPNNLGIITRTIDNHEIEKKFLDRRNKLLVNHANERVGEYFRSQTVTPALAAGLMARYCAAQGRGLPWSHDVGKNLYDDRIKRFKEWVNSDKLIF